MSNVSSSNGLEKYPKLRFKGFSEPWESVPFGSLIKEYSIRTKVEDEDVLLSAAIEGMFLNSELFGHQRGASNIGYKKIKYGTLVLSTQNLHLGNANVNQRFEHGMVSPAYKTYEITGCSIDLIAQWVKSEKAKKFFFDATTVGASLCRRNVEWDTLYEQPFYLPSSEEQEKVASFLRNLSLKIEKQERLVEALKKYKRGVSDKLFDEITVTTTLPFGEAFTILQNNTFSRDDMSSEGEVLNIHYGDILVKFGAVLDLSQTVIPFIKSDRNISKFANASYLQEGDVVFADTAEDYTVGKVTEIVGIGNKKVLSGLHTIPCRPTINFAPKFLGYLLNSSRFRENLMPLIQGIKVSSISKTELLKVPVLIPTMDEQIKIASALFHLDETITKQEMLLVLMKKYKQSLLQKLFI